MYPKEGNSGLELYDSYAANCPYAKLKPKPDVSFGGTNDLKDSSF